MTMTIKIVNNNLSNKGNHIKLCQENPIAAGILVAIMGPPEMKEFCIIVHQLSFLYNRCKGNNE